MLCSELPDVDDLPWGREKTSRWETETRNDENERQDEHARVRTLRFLLH